MSAWIVSKQHIDALVTAGLPAPGETIAAVTWGDGNGAEARKSLRKENADEIGRMLWQENHQSINYRYKDGGPVDPLYAFQAESHVPLTVLKLLDCYEYQSCEHPGWSGSEARAFCGALRNKVVQDLPGYETAPWAL